MERKQKMSHHVLLIFLVLLCFGSFAEALMCQTCEIYKFGVGCVTKPGVCEAGPGQKCIFIKYYRKNQNNKAERRCSNPGDWCDRTMEKDGLVIKTACCDYKDHCMYQVKSPVPYHRK